MAKTKELSEEDKLRQKKRRLIFFAVCTFLSAVYVVAFWFNECYCSPQELYHRVWRSTKQNIFDIAALKDFDKLEHAYDDKIHSESDAVKYSNEMLKVLDDPFTTLVDYKGVARRSDAQAGFYSGVGMVMTAKTRPVKVRMVMEGSPAEKAGIKAGDEIISVDNIDCMKVPVYEIGDYTRKHLGEAVHFMIATAGKKRDVPMIPAKIPIASTKSKMLTPEIAYERVESFIPDSLVDKIETDLKKVQGARVLILDLRGNPGGSVDYCLQTASLLMDTGELVTLKSRVPNDGFQATRYNLMKNGLMLITEDDKHKLHSEMQSRRDNLWDNKPILILVDENSASAAEMLAGALRDNKRARLVGTHTYGKGVAQINVMLPLSTLLSLTAGRYYIPSGAWLGDGKFDVIETNGEKKIKSRHEGEKVRGLAPDVVVAPVENLEYGGKEDNQLAIAQKLAQEAISASGAGK